MDEQPIRLSVDDDLERNRLTVFFRLILVIPHYLWLAIWGIGALVAAIVNWLATLIAGRSPEGLHRFLAAYVKYATQVYAYLYLAANPYPSFDGRAGYPVDVAIDPPREQNRLAVAFRLILAIPAILLAAALTGTTGYRYSRSTGGANAYSLSFGLMGAAAFLGWFAVLARGRMPRGLRDVAAWAIGFGAQLWGYLFLLSARYPDPDPALVLAALPPQEHPVVLSGRDELRRSRLTVFFRLLLAIPHFIWLTLWALVALLAAIAGWFAALFTGRLPAPLHRFLAAFVRYQTHVYAFVYLIANPFPGFTGAEGSYPVEARIAPPARQNRWKVGFRVVLAIPAAILVSAYGSFLYATAILTWFAALATGRAPRGLHAAAWQALRYTTQTSGYVSLLTDAYPYSGPCAEPFVG